MKYYQLAITFSDDKPVEIYYIKDGNKISTFHPNYKQAMNYKKLLQKRLPKNTKIYTQCQSGTN